MAYKKYNFIGSSVDYWLPDDITVEIAIVPASRTNVRSNQFSLDQTTVTIHETANFNRGANADMHKRWLHGGAGGEYVGFNFVVDDHKIIQLTPLNEVTWAAGTPAGNRTSWHIESCVNADADLNKTRRNTAALAGAILAAQGWAIGDMVQHNVWYGKWCPALMKANGDAIWKGTFVPQVSEFRAQSIAASKGGNAPAPDPAPNPKGTVATIRFESLLRTSPGFWDYEKNRSNVVTTLPAGTRGEVIDGPREAEGIQWYDLKIEGIGTGWVADTVLHTMAFS